MVQVRHVIVDRDGVLNRERPDGGYVVAVSQWQWIPGAIEGLRMLSAAGVRISVATNQSGIGRGFMDSSALDAIHARMIDEAARQGGVIDRVLYCPHAPDQGCACRKPAPGLLLRAVAESRIPCAATLALGDDVRDLEAAWRAGVVPALVRTGKGRKSEAVVAGRGVPVFADLSDFAASVVSTPPRGP